MFGIFSFFPINNSHDSNAYSNHTTQNSNRDRKEINITQEFDDFILGLFKQKIAAQTEKLQVTEDQFSCLEHAFREIKSEMQHSADDNKRAIAIRALLLANNEIKSIKPLSYAQTFYDIAISDINKRIIALIHHIYEYEKVIKIVIDKVSSVEKKQKDFSETDEPTETEQANTKSNKTSSHPTVEVKHQRNNKNEPLEIKSDITDSNTNAKNTANQNLNNKKAPYFLDKFCKDYTSLLTKKVIENSESNISVDEKSISYGDDIYHNIRLEHYQALSKHNDIDIDKIEDKSKRYGK